MNSHPNDWDFVGVYTDEGISATSTKKRDGFNQMVEDALAGKIQLIITNAVITKGQFRKARNDHFGHFESSFEASIGDTAVKREGPDGICVAVVLLGIVYVLAWMREASCCSALRFPRHINLLSTQLRLCSRT